MASYVDTNILVRMLANDIPEQVEIAARALSEGATLLTFDEDLAKVMQRKQAEG